MVVPRQLLVRTVVNVRGIAVAIRIRSAHVIQKNKFVSCKKVVFKRPFYFINSYLMNNSVLFPHNNFKTNNSKRITKNYGGHYESNRHCQENR